MLHTYAFLWNGSLPDSNSQVVFRVKVRSVVADVIQGNFSISLHPKTIPVVVLVAVEDTLTSIEREAIAQGIESIELEDD